MTTPMSSKLSNSYAFLVTLAAILALSAWPLWLSSVSAPEAWWIPLLASSVVGTMAGVGLGRIHAAQRRMHASMQDLIFAMDDEPPSRIPHLSDPGAVGALARKLMARIQEPATVDPAVSPIDDAAAERDKIKAGVQKFLDDSGIMVSALKRHSQSMRASATTLSEASQVTTAQSDQASVISQDVSGNSQAMAAAIEQLGASIREISGQTTRATGIMSQTAELAHQAQSDVDAVAHMAHRISSIVDTIRTIARQTNLLALNATIEATRAGESGRGFAVVAAEVKALALQTSQATDDVSRQIAAMQASTSATVTSVKTITAKIADVAEMTDVIAGSVEHQNSATREIASRVSATADGSRRAALSAAPVSQAAHQSKEEARVIDAMAGELAQLTQSMAVTINAFVGVVGCDLDDRRHGARTAVEALATVTHGKQTLSVRLQDLSETGARIALDADIPQLSPIILNVAGRNLPARLVWQHEGMAGLVFDQRIADIDALLQRLGAQRQAA